MPQTASILIEVDDSAAISSFRQMSADGAKIGPSLAPAGPALDKMTASTKQSREAAQLLSEELGVNIPRGLRNILAENSLIGPAISAAFSGIAVAGFVTIVKDAVDQLTGFTAQMDTIAKQNQAIMDSTAQANKVLLGPQNLQEINAQILSTSKSIEKLNYELSLSGDSVTDSLLRGLSKYTSLGAALVDELDKEKAHLNDLATEQAKLNDEQTRVEPIEMLKQQNEAREAGLVGLKAVATSANDQIAVIQKQIDINKALSAVLVAQTGIPINYARANAVAYAQIDAIKAKEKADAIKYYQSEDDASVQLAQHAWEAWVQGSTLIERTQQDAIDNQQTLLSRGLIDQQTFEDRKKSIISTGDAQIYRLQIQQLNEVAAAESDAAVAMAAPWERSYAQIAADTQKQLRQIQQELDATAITGTQAAELTAAAWQENFAKTRDQMADELETFFDDVTSGNIGQFFKKKFEDLVSQMVATWILGMRGMQGATQQTFGTGGLLGLLFPGIFGGGGGGGSAPSASLGDLGSLGLLSSLGGFSASDAGGDIGSLPTGLSSGLVSLIPGLGLSAGQGSIPGGVLPSGSSTGAKPGGLLGLLSGGNLGSLLSLGAVVGGGALLGSNNTILKTLGGGLTGAGIGAIAGPLLTAIAETPLLGGLSIGLANSLIAIAPFLGPIGAAIGILIPLLSRLFGPHTGDTARIQVMEPLLASIKTITDSYDVFQTDYNTGISELETLRTNSLAALKKIGGNQVKGNSAATNQRIDAAEQHLQDTEAERQRRAQINFGPPQFHEGGLVRGGLAAIYGRPEFHGGGEVNANLLIGEGVVNRRAMGVLGESGLNSLNAGGRIGDTHNHFYSINAIEPSSFAAFLSKSGMVEIAKAWRRASREGMRI